MGNVFVKFARFFHYEVYNVNFGFFDFLIKFTAQIKNSLHSSNLFSLSLARLLTRVIALDRDGWTKEERVPAALVPGKILKSTVGVRVCIYTNTHSSYEHLPHTLSHTNTNIHTHAHSPSTTSTDPTTWSVKELKQALTEAGVAHGTHTNTHTHTHTHTIYIYTHTHTRDKLHLYEFVGKYSVYMGCICIKKNKKKTKIGIRSEHSSIISIEAVICTAYKGIADAET